MSKITEKQILYVFEHNIKDVWPVQKYSDYKTNILYVNKLYTLKYFINLPHPRPRHPRGAHYVLKG